MGGGSTTVSAYYGSKRKVALSMMAIERTGDHYGVSLKREGKPNVEVVSEKDWAPIATAPAAVYAVGDTIRIRRKYFAGRRTQNVITHEVLHSYSGPHNYYRGSLSADLEEGTVEYLTQGTRTHGYRGRGKRYAGGYRSYPAAVKDVSLLMRAVGRANYLKLWQEGFTEVHQTRTLKAATQERERAETVYRRDSRRENFVQLNNAALRVENLEKRNTNYRRLANMLSQRGYKNTAELIRQNYEKKEKPHRISSAINKDVREGNPHPWGAKEGSKITVPLDPDEEEMAYT